MSIKYELSSVDVYTDDLVEASMTESTFYDTQVEGLKAFQEEVEWNQGRRKRGEIPDGQSAMVELCGVDWDDEFNEVTAYDSVATAYTVI